jgi:arylsulfatase A-like enzyme
MMDIMPTAVQVAGGELPTDRTIDGHDIRAILLGDADAVSPYDEQGFFYYHMHQLQAVRSGQWKLYLPLANKIEDLRGDYDNGRSTTAELYDVRHDVGETRNVVAELPDVVALLTALADSARRDLGDWDREGSDQRPAGWVDDPTPQVLSSPN